MQPIDLECAQDIQPRHLPACIVRAGKAAYVEPFSVPQTVVMATTTIVATFFSVSVNMKPAPAIPAAVPDSLKALGIDPAKLDNYALW